MRRVLVTGATGFVARHLIPQLIAGHWQVVGVARAGARPRWLPELDWVETNLGRWPEVRGLIERIAPQAVIHLAGQVRGPYAELCTANVTAANHLLQAARDLAPDLRLVLVGSAAEYGAVAEGSLPIDELATCEPQGAYGSTKLAATLLAQAAARDWGARVSIVRPFNVIGAHMPTSFVAGALLGRIDAALAAGGAEQIAIGRTDTTRDFVDVGDLSTALVRLLDIDARGEIFNLCSGRETSIQALLETTIALAGGGLTWKVDPSLLRPGDVARSFGDFTKARRLLGFEPHVGLEESLRAAWDARAASRA
jgi:GDP-4-dehydro-6-deoxy-D-mannose reductase